MNRIAVCFGELNMFVVHLQWRSETMALARPGVEAQGDLVKLGLTVDGQVGALGQKQGSECTFRASLGRFFARTPDFCRSRTARELRFDGRAEALRSQGVLTLQVDADGVDE